MKHVIRIGLLLSVINIGSAQQPALPYTLNEKTKLYEFTEVIKTNKTAEELTHLAFNWAIGYKAMNYIKKVQEGVENSQTVHWKDADGSVNILTGKNFMTRGGGSIICQVNYTVKIQIQNNTYRFTITNLRYKHLIRTLNNKKCFTYYTPLEIETPLCSGFKNSLLFTHRLIKKRTLIQVNETMWNLKQFMALDLNP
jgi:hypothetical protein